MRAKRLQQAAKGPVRDSPRGVHACNGSSCEKATNMQCLNSGGPHLCSIRIPITSKEHSLFTCTLTFIAIVSVLNRCQHSVPAPNDFGMDTPPAASCSRSSSFPPVCVGVAGARGMSLAEAAARVDECEDARGVSVDGGTARTSDDHK